MARGSRKIIILIILLLALGITIGFAAFSSTLIISSEVEVMPSETSFKVVFSNKIDSVDTSDVTAVATPSTISTTKGKIDNSMGPTISDLSAIFTTSGQKVVYSFYVYNSGNHVAHLNSITFRGNKNCEAVDTVNSSLLTAACDSIKMTVQVGSVTTNITKTDIKGETLTQGQGKQVTVTLEYLETGTLIDGAISIEFPDVSLYYATVEGQNEDYGVCKLVSGDLNTYGSVVECGPKGTEKFYVIPDHDNAPEGTVSLLAKYNLNVGDAPIPGTIGIQNSEAVGGEFDSDGSFILSNCNYKMEDFENATQEEMLEMLESLNCGASVSFSNSIYWETTNNNIFVYNEQSNLHSYVEAYKNYLSSNGANIIKATIPSYNQLITLGCALPDGQTYVGSCQGSFDWVYSTTYWTGSAPGAIYIRVVQRNGSFAVSEMSGGEFSGVRPVIIISEDDIKVS